MLDFPDGAQFAVRGAGCPDSRCTSAEGIRNPAPVRIHRIPTLRGRTGSWGRRQRRALEVEAESARAGVGTRRRRAEAAEAATEHPHLDDRLRHWWRAVQPDPTIRHHRPDPERRHHSRANGGSARRPSWCGRHQVCLDQASSTESALECSLCCSSFASVVGPVPEDLQFRQPVSIVGHPSRVARRTAQAPAQNGGCCRGPPRRPPTPPPRQHRDS